MTLVCRAGRLDCRGARAPRNDGERFALNSPRHCERSAAIQESRKRALVHLRGSRQGRYQTRKAPSTRSYSRGRDMKRVAVFGNAGGGKSTLAGRLAELSGLPLYVVDLMQFGPGGAKVPHEDFLRTHGDLLRRDEWIIDGFGNAVIVGERLAVAETI